QGGPPRRRPRGTRNVRDHGSSGGCAGMRGRFLLSPIERASNEPWGRGPPWPQPHSSSTSSASSPHSAYAPLPHGGAPATPDSANPTPPPSPPHGGEPSCSPAHSSSACSLP